MKELDPGEKCCDEVHETDGRDDDGEDHKGDWGNHSTADREHNLEENENETYDITSRISPTSSR